MDRLIGTKQKAFVCLFLIAIFGSACEQELDREQTIYAFGTIVTVRAYGTSDEQFRSAVAALEQEFNVVDVNWYPWAKGKLAAINHAIADGRATRVEPDLAALIRSASKMERLSNGLFNPAMGALTQLWGLDDMENPPQSLPDPAAIKALLESGLTTGLLQWQGDTLRSASRNIALDLGGIAKGAILALSIDTMLKHGIRNAIVDIGGDLTVIGSVNGRAARIGIRSPSGSGVAGVLTIGDGETVATSGDYERFFEIDGRRYQHILDPRTGYPVSHTASVTVVHTNPLLADAAATALLVGGPAEFDEICRVLAITEAVLIDASGDLRLTSAMRMRVKWAN